MSEKYEELEHQSRMLFLHDRIEPSGLATYCEESVRDK